MQSVTGKNAGIGGNGGNGGDITIYGGTVMVTGNGAGIGGGRSDKGGADGTEPGGSTTEADTTEPGAYAQPAGCVSDTVSEVSVSGAYQFRLTSTDGLAPVVAIDSESFRAVLASQEENDYFWKIYAVGSPGQTCTVTVNGTVVARLTAVSSVFGPVFSDTTAPFTVAAGGSYQFRPTAVEKPTMAAGSPSFTVEYVGNDGFDWFFKVYAVGKAGDGCGFYVNSAPVPVAVAHIN